MREFFLDPEFALLEQLDGHEVRQGAALFVGKLSLEAGMFEL
jgi:hypothetical protein